MLHKTGLLESGRGRFIISSALPRQSITVFVPNTSPLNRKISLFGRHVDSDSIILDATKPEAVWGIPLTKLLCVS